MAVRFSTWQFSCMSSRKPKPSWSPHKAQVGNRLRWWMQANGVKQKDWAEKYGCSVNQLSNWLAGDNYPDIPLAIRFVRKNGLTLDWLFSEEWAGVAAFAEERLMRSKKEKPEALSEQAHRQLADEKN